MSPSPRGRYAAGSLSAAVLFALGNHAHAVEFVTNSGALLRQNAPLTGANAPQSHPDAAQDAFAPTTAPAATTNEIRFPVQEIQLEGELSAAERQRIDALVAPLRGSEVTLSQLQALRGVMSLALYQESHELVSVLLPRQTVADGVVRFQLVRGHIEQVRVDNASQVDTGVIARVFAARRGSLRDVERGIALVRQFPGVDTVQATLSEGEEQGGTIITVHVTPSSRFRAAVMADNAGSSHAGTQRVGVQLGIDNAFGHGDRLDMLAYATPSAFQSKAERGGETRLSRVSYDTLVGSHGARVGAAYSEVGYRLGGIFDGLGKGDARVTTLYASAPAQRSPNSDIDLSATLERKKLDDLRFGDLLESRRRGTAASLRADGDVSRALRSLDMSLHYNLGVRAGRIDGTDIDRSTEPSSVETRRRDFVLLEGGADATKWLAARWVATAQVHGQWANRSLDSSERFMLGGPGAVRAYNQDAPTMDSGGVVSLGASYMVPGLPGVSMDAFYDYAHGRTRADGAIRSGTATLQGVGGGLSWQRRGFQAQASYAVPTGRKPASTDNGQLWFTLRASF